MSTRQTDQGGSVWADQGSRVEILLDDSDKAPEGRRPLASREDRCWNLSPAIQARLEAELVECLLPTAQTISGQTDDEALRRRLAEILAEFFPLYKNRPIQNNKGGGLINDSLCLYVSARLIAPEFILESGSYQGHSAWLLRQACPTAHIISCDIDHSQLLYRTEGVTYHQGDWMELDLPAFNPKTALVWFDDHIDHGRRLKEAAARGFHQALFDDNFPATNLYATGGIPVPTLDMILDDLLEDNCEIIWSRRGKNYRYRHDLAHAVEARKLISEFVKLPDLTQLTRYSPPSGMSFVRLKQS